MENMRVPELKALAREHRLRGYSRLRKAELIALLQDNEIRPRDDRDLHRCLLGNQNVNRNNPIEGPLVPIPHN